MTWSRAVNALAVVGIVVSLAFVGATAMVARGDDVLVRIEGGSMMPTLAVGDVISVRRETFPRTGDVVTFMHDGHRTTHRVTRAWTARDPGGTVRRLYRTKGDANRVDDHWVVTEQQLVGTMAPMSAAAMVAVAIEKNSTFLALLFLPQLLTAIGVESLFIGRHVRGARGEKEESPERDSNPQDVTIRGV